ncbi:hypothetical protein E3Q22_03090 [Wallemia mellicola]|uniref:Splicing factor Cactin n=1 Tax=Wallemia mellicola TaxID=1708541 RepID=A0A4T0LL69_9BASI|nr:hypothetical protein E3Q24_02904 [Wallemia mellicola]TIB77387.1 hypothetical protein E3Q22_03090 [Wallemia mellicola]TIB83171.1 hypothetical protein E3Q21_03051 [Wallemia mellicola]TIB85986.1 hypothetical protein E3Q20_03042 [Wallemia mellicola]TIC03429.1 hypothetical protein E3Q16_03037 [Wallemia mellicola]
MSSSYKRYRSDNDFNQEAGRETKRERSVDNPINYDDDNKFKWQKKEERDRKLGLSAQDAAIRDQKRRAEAQAELEKLTRRRQQREIERKEREDQNTRRQRMNESAQTQEWLNKEDEFMLEQKRLRALMRIRGNRAQPIDFLCLNLKFAHPDTTHTRDDEEELETGLEVDLDEPYHILENLNLNETKALHKDICEFLDLEIAEANKDFWHCMLAVCQDKLERIAQSMGGSHVVDEDVEEQIEMILKGKSLQQLTQLQQSIQNKLRSDEAIDTEYWENLLKSLMVYKAKAKLNDMHKLVLNNRLSQLRERQKLEGERIESELTKTMTEDKQEKPTVADSTPAEDILADEYDPAMSPKPTHKNQLPYEDRQMPLILIENDVKNLMDRRRQLKNTSFIARSELPQKQVALRADDVGASIADVETENWFRLQDLQTPHNYADEFDNDDIFTETQEAAKVTYTWNDKNRPRKPRYFNRVHTGYEWNKYNQTHYDYENPPPKVVQGYKFNIFYPDLIDKTKTPTYKVIKNPDNSDISTIIFIAGPPYEDIAFTIVNREWEHSHKRGFRSSFDRGVMQLYFNFKKIFYRK